ncbi:JAB domain-containing protein [Aeromonas bivalvium]|uniref:JAB domain-containing protein n=1 Tax=Aeromonas bivalvium TaxID=440079 RepID=UPI0038D00060
MPRRDCIITQRLQTALALVDIRTLDHLVVGRREWCRWQNGGTCNCHAGQAARSGSQKAWSAVISTTTYHH